MRLFVAIRFSAETQARLSAAVELLRSHGRGSFTPPQNLHLTLAFLGETAQEDAARAALQRIESDAASFTVKGLGQFERLCYAAVEPSDTLSTLQAEVALRFREAGFLLDEREFIPHITLARRYEPRNASFAQEAAAALSTPHETAREILLMESRQTPQGTRYLPLSVQPLR